MAVHCSKESEMKHLSVVARTGDIDLLPPNDLLRGATAIALFLFDDPEQRRIIYHMFEKKRIPAFRVGKRIYARKSSLSIWIDRLEASQNESSSQPDLA